MSEAYELQTKFNHFIWKLRGFLLIPLISSCSLVQLSPTMNCQHIIYERTGNEVQVLAKGCQV
jgi:hypothetical protein